MGEGRAAAPAAALRPLREVVRGLGRGPARRLGQHFLLDPSILARIAAAAEPLDGRTVLEVGPGPGGLTRALLATGLARLVAVERDRRCLPALAELAAAYPDRLEVRHGDALGQRLAGLGGEGGPPVAIVANLPYNVGTELLLGWFGELDRVERMVLMFQREVALRLSAAPGSADWGRLGALAQTLCHVERPMELPPEAFVPPPKVASAVVRLTPRPDRPGPALVAGLEAVTRAAFGQRRKMLRAALRELAGVSAAGGPEALLGAADIVPTRRAETLSLAELHALAGAYVAALSPVSLPPRAEGPRRSP